MSQKISRQLEFFGNDLAAFRTAVDGITPEAGLRDTASLMHPNSLQGAFVANSLTTHGLLISSCCCCVGQISASISILSQLLKNFEGQIDREIIIDRKKLLREYQRLLLSSASQALTHQLSVENTRL